MLLLTNDQRLALRWLVEQVAAGRLPETFYITWEGGFSLPVITFPLGAPRPPNELTEGALRAWAHGGYVLADPPQGSRLTYRVTLLGRAYEALATSGGSGTAGDVAALIDLRDFIDAHFDEEEMRDLCFALGLKYDNLGGRTLRGKARELVLHFVDLGEVDRLRAELRRMRPAHQTELDDNSRAA